MGGVYLVTSPKRPVSALLSIVAAALEAGVSIVQLRDKGVYTEAERAEAARGIAALCGSHDAPFLVNDDPRLARQFEADGVHVGRADPSPRVARSLLGPKAIIGVTVYGKQGEEVRAEREGADYLAIGPFFPSPTKPEEPELPLHVLDAVVARTRLPVFAIGGIDVQRARILARHRIAGIAVVSAVMDAPDPRRAATDLRRAFEEARSPTIPRT